MLSAFFLLSSKGDTIISRNYRPQSLEVSTHEAAASFFREAKFFHDTSEEAPPCFELDGLHYLYIQRNQLYFVAVTRFNVSGNFILETLNRLAQTFKDYCGLLSEEAIRKNFVLVYELLDETIDFGYPQCMDTSSLKMMVYNEPVVVNMEGRTAGVKTSGKNKKKIAPFQLCQ